MFAKTFSTYAKHLDLDDPQAVVAFIGETLQKEVVGRRPAKIAFFADAARGKKKLVFYDVSSLEDVVEFSSFFTRLPEYCVECDGTYLKIYYFHPEFSLASVFDLHRDTTTGIVSAAVHSEAMSTKETQELRSTVGSTDGLLQASRDICGRVVCSVVENEHKERRPFFTVKLDVKHEKYRPILRSCQRVYFAWSEDVSSMVMICRFRMLPAFALTFPVMGRGIQESMKLYIETDRAVGLIMYADDVSDAFTVEKGSPLFE